MKPNLRVIAGRPASAPPREEVHPLGSYTYTGWLAWAAETGFIALGILAGSAVVTLYFWSLVTRYGQ